MSKPARATISDVAKAAKTGKTSISRYLNGEKHLLSDALLARIEQAIADLDYRPSLMARGLKREYRHLFLLCPSGGSRARGPGYGHAAGYRHRALQLR